MGARITWGAAELVEPHVVFAKRRPLSIILASVALQHGVAQESAPSKATDSKPLQRQILKTKTREVACTTVTTISSKVPIELVELVATQPPTSDSQTLVSGPTYSPRPDDVSTYMDGPNKVDVLLYRFDDKHAPTVLTITASYEIDLCARRMVTYSGAEPPCASSAQLTWIAETDIYDYRSAEFRAWREHKRLDRGKDESTVDFVRRAFSVVRDQVALDSSAPRSESSKLSQLMRRASGDCGDMAVLFVGIMRSNGVGCRAAAGHWAVDGAPSGSGLVAEARLHVKAEFWEPSVGWIPVDIGRRSGHEQFGLDAGDFVTFHFDPGVAILRKEGPSDRAWWAQVPALWVIGPEDLGQLEVKYGWRAKPRVHLESHVATRSTTRASNADSR